MGLHKSAIKFVTVYMQVYNKGGTGQDIADIIGCSRQAVAQRADRLRAKGVALPEIATEKAAVLDELKDIVSRLGKA